MGKEKKETLVSQIQNLQVDLQMKATPAPELMKQKTAILVEMKESLEKAEKETYSFLK